MPMSFVKSHLPLGNSLVLGWGPPSLPATLARGAPHRLGERPLAVGGLPPGHIPEPNRTLAREEGELQPQEIEADPFRGPDSC